MKYLVGIISVLVVVVLVGSVMVPIIDDSARGVEREDNPDWAGWVRFDLNTSTGATYQLGMSQDANGIYVDSITSGATDRQIYDDSSTGDYETIMYADSNMVVWSIDDTFNVQGKVNGNPVFINSTALNITRSADGVQVITDSDSVTFVAPTWAYVPFSDGKYGFYPYDESRGVEHPASAPVAVLGGGNVGVYAYNDIYTYDGLGLAMNPIIEDGKYYGATWAKPAAEPNPDDITITPLDPSIIGGGDAGTNPVVPIVIDDPFEPDAGTMAVPTPTYTDGVWGYDLTTVSGVQKAVIVSYSGAGGDIVVPATIGGYDVYRFGKSLPTTSSISNVVMDNTSISAGSSIEFPEGIIQIGAGALWSISNMTGSLIIPSSVEQIGGQAFYGCQFTGSLIIPSSVELIGDYAFRNCIPTNVIIASDAIPGSGALLMSTVTEILDLSDTVDYSVDRYGAPSSAIVYDSIGDCFGFVSIVTTSSGAPGVLSQYSNLIYAIPIVIIASLLVAFAAFITRRDY